jgi:subtilisin-like proprotein convertase family protein
MEANALSYDYGQIHVYSSSWGPADDGLRLEGPGTLTRAAIADAVANGRGGLGSIYVWAGGNGAQNHDNVNYDGYANSRYVNAIAALTDSGLQAYYSEPGAPLILAAPSSGGIAGITTTDLLGANGYNNSVSPGGDCTSSFGGTSAAAPLVAGVTALMLQANPDLGWRDVKHLAIATAAKNDATNAGWANNGAGRHVNHAYGYGRVDASAAVAAARTRTRNLGTEVATDSGTLPVALAIPDNNATGVTATFTMSTNLIVEHVEVVFNATHPHRGDLRVVLTSPAGTQSVLADVHGDANADYAGWKFSSMRHWGEVAAGIWSIRVSDGVSSNTGAFNSWQLIIHGRDPVFSDVGTHQWSWRNIEALYQAGITNGCSPGAFCPDNVVTRAQMAVLLERAIRGGASAQPTCTGTTFTDVGPTTFACGWIEQLLLDGITTGCGNGAYCPGNPVSRTQMAIFLLRVKHGATYAPTACTGAVFGDVSASTYGCAWIEQLAAEGITTGCGGGNYCPNQTVDRAQMAAFLTRSRSLVQP